MDERTARAQLERYGQGHVLQFWDQLTEPEQTALLTQIASIDFELMTRLIDTWVLNTPPTEHFSSIEPVPLIKRGAPDAQQAWDAGEEAIRQGRVALFLVAGGQGTRLGFNGPKGAYPIGPVSGRSLFSFHAEKILNLQRRYRCVLPWYIMVSDTNREETLRFFEENAWFGLCPGSVHFFTQRMAPCVDKQGRFLLDAPGRLAMNPNGHGGCIPAMVENGVLDDMARRGADLLSYFQVDNWAVKVVDPLIIGYHVLRGAEMSSKCHRKNAPREEVGVHCLADGEYRVIEYSELDIYRQLLETHPGGSLRFAAGNPAIHVLSADFVRRVYDNYTHFPWHRAEKRIPYVDESGNWVEPSGKNGYKFETFVFDALRFVKHPPVALEMERPGEYTPIKSFTGTNSVESAWHSMREFWRTWLDVAGFTVPPAALGEEHLKIEISPDFALTQDEFLQRVHDGALPPELALKPGQPVDVFAIGPQGEWIPPDTAQKNGAVQEWAKGRQKS